MPMKTLIFLSLLGSLGCSDDLSPNQPPTYKAETDDSGTDQGDDARVETDPETDRIPSTSSDTTIEPDLDTVENPAEPNSPPVDSTTPEKPDTGEGTTAPTPPTGRSLALPIGIENINDSPMKLATTQTLLRFVTRTTITIDRFYFGFRLQGADCDKQGTLGSGAGNGGIIFGSIVSIDPGTGLPGAAIVSESINGCERFNEAYTELQNKSLPTLVWINARATLEANRLYGFVVRNSDMAPATNFFSFTMPIADTVLAGPHAKNNLDANAKGAILGMDPRELVAWSADSGKSWKFGSENGQFLSYMNNSDKLHPATRVPEYGFRLSSGANLAGQPYYALGDDCVGCTITFANAASKLSLTQLGAFTSSGTNVGTLTITNSKSAASASCTPAQGYGYRSCKLPGVFTVEKGDSYTIKASGSVEVLRLDNAQQLLFPDVGTTASEFRMFQASPAAGTKARDVPQIWAAADSI